MAIKFVKPRKNEWKRMMECIEKGCYNKARKGCPKYRCKKHCSELCP